ncbi:MAG TPA: hypothetical protein VHB98_17550 [Chloroflexota bacterium]|jgi:DNA-directed RNA polymerase subunit RPC12/RpoP|nr:hypothetical protein [Chloroflexota bacterium]
MNDNRSIHALRPKRDAIGGVCVDCGREVAAADVARVLRVDSQGRGRVVCNDCSARIHAAKGPAPIPLRRAPRKGEGTDKASG